MKRPYDPAIPPELYKLVMQARVTPRGLERPVKLVPRGEDMVRSYPWDQMTFGDFFHVDMDESALDAFRVMVAQKSMRMDCELVLHKTKLGTPEEPRPGVWRVTVIRTCNGILAFKKNMRLYHGKDVRIPDIKKQLATKSENRKASYDRLTGKSRNVVQLPPPRPSKRPAPEKPAEVSAISNLATESPTYDPAAARAALRAKMLAELKNEEEE